MDRRTELGGPFGPSDSPAVLDAIQEKPDDPARCHALAGRSADNGRDGETA